MTFDYSQLGLAAILKQNRLAVPRNQRDYAWTAKEVGTLLEDLSRSISAGDSDYFLGTIVAILGADDVLEVVDGQQRLATTAILLAEIRDYLKNRTKVRADFIESEFLTTIDWDAEERVPRLRLNVDDNDYFRARLAEGNSRVSATKKSHERIEAAFELAHQHVRDIVAGLPEEAHSDVLNRWVKFLQKRATAVLLCVTSGADAYRMFETLNDRGLRASQADLVKNYLFGRSGARIHEVERRWSSMRAALEGVGDPDDVTIRFLRHSLVLVRGFVRKNDVYAAVQERASAVQGAVTLAGEFETLAAVYGATYSSDHEHWKGLLAAKKALLVLNEVDVKPLRPLILAVASTFKGREVAAALHFCSSLAVRLMITGRTRTGSVEEGLADASHRVYRSKVKTARGLKTALENLTPSDPAFRSAFETASVSNAKLARYYLRSLERTVSAEPQPWLIPNDDPRDVNLEHILPRKPEGNWPQFNEDELKLYGRRIGNLCLLTSKENSVVKSSRFEVKRAVYKKSPYRLTSEVAAVDAWTADEIVKRQMRLAEIALRTW